MLAKRLEGGGLVIVDCEQGLEMANPERVPIGVGRTDWFRPLPPPNRAGGSPAHGSPVSGLLYLEED